VPISQVKPTTTKIELQPASPEFEQLAAGQIAEQSKTDGRGGARAGAGRPRGATDEFAAVNRLPEKPNLTLVPVIKIPFALWASAQGIAELELNKNEGEEVALPVTQLLEYYFPGKIPEIAWVWLLMFSSLSNVLEPRLKLLAKKRKEKSAQGQNTVPTGKGPGTFPQTGPSHSENQPATGFPKNV
jgi:hypothetical protein